MLLPSKILGLAMLLNKKFNNNNKSDQLKNKCQKLFLFLKQKDPVYETF